MAHFSKLFYLVYHILLLLIHTIINFCCFYYFLYYVRSFILYVLYVMSILAILFEVIEQCFTLFNLKYTTFDYISTIDTLFIMSKLLFTIFGTCVFVDATIENIQSSMDIYICISLLLLLDLLLVLILRCIVKARLMNNYFESHFCSICLEENSVNLYQVSPCNHVFHNKCFLNWCLAQMQQQQQLEDSAFRCPECRSIVTNFDIFIHI